MTALPPIPESWAEADFFTTRWPALYGRLVQTPNWQPHDLFRALQLTPRPKVRVVILGQDPYPTMGRATGLAFAFPQGQEPQDSLRNIFKELEDDTGASPLDATLEGWARQGVLLLNTVLSVPVGRPGGHKGWGWEILTRQILQMVADDGPRAFVLWGREAQKTAAFVPRNGEHLVIESAHPSPLSAHRGFFGSKPFSKINHWLHAGGQPVIDWGK